MIGSGVIGIEAIGMDVLRAEVAYRYAENFLGAIKKEGKCLPFLINPNAIMLRL